MESSHLPQPNLSLHVQAAVVQRLHGAATSMYPEEVCGLLLGESQAGQSISVRQAVVVPNAADVSERTSRYAIAPRLMLEWERIAQKSGLSIVGFFHSHPDQPPVPSATDAALAWPGYVYVIISARRAAGHAEPMITGMAAWTFAEASARFVEVGVSVEVADDEIEYFI